MSRALTTEKQGYAKTASNFVGQTIIDKSTEMSYEMRGGDYLTANRDSLTGGEHILISSHRQNTHSSSQQPVLPLQVKFESISSKNQALI